MNTDIRINTMLMTNPKTKKLRRRLGGDGFYSLIALWVYTATTRPEDGELGSDIETIEIAADWLGEEGLFVRTLVDIGFLDCHEGGYRVHDWAEHQPWAKNAKKRSEAARRNVEKRWAAEREKKAARHAENTNGIRLVYDSYRDANTPFLSSPNLSKDITPPISPPANPPPAKPLAANAAASMTTEDPPIEKSSKPKRTRPNPPPLPEAPPWLTAWPDWLQHRRELKKPVSATSAAKQLAQLERWRNAGHDPNSIINHAIAAGWQGLYLPREMTHGKHQRPFAQRPNIQQQAAEAVRLADKLAAEAEREQPRSDDWLNAYWPSDPGHDAVLAEHDERVRSPMDVELWHSYGSRCAV